MFQIGFWECVVVALVALCVFGPEQLPTIATMAGRYLGRFKKALNSFKTEFQEISNEKNSLPKKHD